MVEVEAVDGVLGLQTRESEAAVDRAGVTCFELAVQQSFESFAALRFLLAASARISSRCWLMVVRFS